MTNMGISSLEGIKPLYEAYYGMSGEEYRRYKNWRNNHDCVSQVEITIVPCCVQDLIKVRCFSCDEIFQVSNFDEA